MKIGMLLPTFLLLAYIDVYFRWYLFRLVSYCTSFDRYIAIFRQLETNVSELQASIEAFRDSVRTKEAVIMKLCENDNMPDVNSIR